jgi:hypothetical protein
VPNKRTRALQEQIEASGLTPLDYMLQVMRNTKLRWQARFEAAKTAAPYVHPKLAIEHTGKNGGPIKTQDVSDIEAGRRMLDARDVGRVAWSPAITAAGSPGAM